MFFYHKLQITAVAQGNCPGPDYSVINKLIASLNATVKPVRSVGYPEPLSLNISRYSNFWTWNYIGQQYADTINNITSFILQGYSFFSSSINNTKGDWNSLVANISQMITVINSSSETMTIPMNYAATQFINFGLNMQLLFSKFLNIFSSYSTMLPLLNMNATPANILKYIPSPSIMTAILNQIGNQTNQYIALVNSTAKDINNTYGLFKQADPYFLAIDTQYNSTIRNMSLSTNKSIVFMNQTLSNFTKSANTIYNSFMNSLPASLKSSSAWQSVWTTGNSSRDEFIALLNTMASVLNNTLIEYFNANKMSLDQLYIETIIGSTEKVRHMMFSLFTSNVSYNQCYSKFFIQESFLLF